MDNDANGVSRRTFALTAIGLGVVSQMAPMCAFGATAAEKQAEADVVRSQLISLQADLENASENYYGALLKQEVAQKAMDAEQVRIDDASAQIANLQNALGARARSMYRSGPSTLLDFLIGATSFTEFTQNWDILNYLNESDAKAVARVRALREGIEAAKAEYAEQEKVYAGEAEIAKTIKDGVEVKVAQANELMASLDAEARQLLEQEQAAAAAAAAARKQADVETQWQEEGSAHVSNTPIVNEGIDVDVFSYGSVVDYAVSRIGCPYIWGAEGPDAFDCSGLVTWAYRQVGIELTHQSEAQYAAARQRVPVSEARPGDVLWRFGHVGIAIGYGGQPYVHAPNVGLLVRDTDPLSWAEFTCALRF